MSGCVDMEAGWEAVRAQKTRSGFWNRRKNNTGINMMST